MVTMSGKARLTRERGNDGELGDYRHRMTSLILYNAIARYLRSSATLLRSLFHLVQ